MICSALELFLVKRKTRGPSWLAISKFSGCPTSQQVRIPSLGVLHYLNNVYESFSFLVSNLTRNNLFVKLSQVSWCKFEFVVDSPKDIHIPMKNIEASTSSGCYSHKSEDHHQWQAEHQWKCLCIFYLLPQHQGLILNILQYHWQPFNCWHDVCGFCIYKLCQFLHIYGW